MTKIMLQPDYVTRPELNMEIKKLEIMLTKQQDNHLGAMNEIFSHELSKSVEILSGLLDSKFNILTDNLYENIDDKFRSMENRLGSKFGKRLESFVTRIDKKFDKRFESFEKKIDAKMDAKFDMGFDSFERKIDAKFDNFKAELLFELRK